MPVTNFQSIVSAQSVGSADVEKLAASFAGLEGAIDRASKKADALNEHKGFGEFAEKVRSGIENPLQAIGGAAEAALKSLGPVGAVAAGVATGLVAAGAAGMSFARDLGHLADEIEDTASRMGLTIRETGEFRFAMQYAGGDISTLQGVMRKLSQEIDSGGENLQGAGIQFRDFTTGSARPMSEVILGVAERLRGMEDVAARNTLAVKLLGRSALEVLPDLMELGDGIARAKELGLGPSEDEIARWNRYHKQMVEVDAQWEALKRDLKDPIAATILFAIKGAGSVGAAADAPGALLRQMLFGGSPDAIDLQMDETGGWGYGASLSRRGQRGVKDSIGRSDAAIDALLAPGELERAKAKLQELAAKLPRGVTETASSEARAAYQEQLDVVRGLEARKKATEDLEAAVKRLAAWEEQLGEKELDPVAKIFAQRDQFPASLRGRATDAALPAAVEELAKMTAERAGMTGKFGRWSNEQTAGNQANEVANFEAYRADFVRNFLEYVQPRQGATQRIGDLAFSDRGFAASADASRQDRLQLMMFGPGHEADAVAASYKIRVDLARQLYGIEMEQAATIADAQQRRIAEAKAESQLRRDASEADIERELRLADIQRMRIDRWRAFAVGGVDALVDGNLGGFARQQGRGVLNRVVGNAAELGWSSVSTMIPHAAQGSFLGKLLAGSEFGPDPAKVAGVRLESAGDRLTLAAGELMGAARALAMSPSSGGGGYAGAAAAAAHLAGGGGSAWWGPFGESLGNRGGEDLPDSYLGGGDWGDGTMLPAHNGGFSWGRAAGIGGAAAGGVLGMYSGIRSGGLRGAATATGSALAAAGSIMALASKALSWAGPVGMIAGLGLGFLPTLFGDPRKHRAEDLERERMSRAYTAPEGREYSVDVHGRPVDYDYRGTPRTVNITVNAVDAQSFGDALRRNAVDVVTAVAGAVGGGDGEELVGHLQNRLGV